MNDVKKNRVCHLATGHNALDNRIFYREAQSLYKAGYKVTLIANHDKKEIVKGVLIIPIEGKTRLRKKFINPFLIIKIAMQQDVDVYHLHELTLLPAGLLLKIFTRKKVVYDVHELYAKRILNKSWIPTKPIRTALSYCVRIMEYNISKYFDGIILAIDEQKSYFPKIIPTCVLYNYPIIKLGNDNYNYIRNGNEIIYIGTMYKGTLFLLEAINYVKEKIPEVKLTIGGNFHNSVFKEKFFDYIKESNLYNSVNYIGYVPFSKVYNYLVRADIGVVVTLPHEEYLGLPTKIFEYMQAKLPVVLNDFPQLREYISKNDCGIMVNGDSPKDFANALIELLTNPCKRVQMGENGYEAIENYYNWEMEGKKLLSFYRDLHNNSL